MLITFIHSSSVINREIGPLSTRTAPGDSESQPVIHRVPLIARSWDLGLEEVETQGGNGRERERGGEENVAFVSKMI